MKTLLLILIASAGMQAQQTPYPVRAVQKVFVQGSGEDDKLLGIAAMAVSRAGLIYVLERRACTVKVFEPTGKFVRRFGTAGTGNGQCSRPVGLSMTDSTVIITDAPSGPPPATGRFVPFTLEGKSRPATDMPGIPVRDPAAAPVANPGRPMRGGGRLFFTNADRKNIVTFQAPSSEARDTLFAVPLDLAVIERAGRSGNAPTGFGAGGVFAFSGDSLVIHADGYTGEVRWLTFSEKGVTVSRTEKIGFTLDAVTPQDLVDRANKMAETTRIPSADGSAAQSMPPGSITITGGPERFSVASSIMRGSDGAYWISNPRREMFRTTNPDEPYSDARAIYTVFPVTGAPYAVRLPVGFILQQIIGNRLYGYTLSKGGTVVVYEVGS